MGCQTFPRMFRWQLSGLAFDPLPQSILTPLQGATGAFFHSLSPANLTAHLPIRPLRRQQFPVQGLTLFICYLLQIKNLRPAPRWHTACPTPGMPALVRPNPDAAPTEAAAGPHFRLLLTEDRDHPNEHWTRQLSHLLEPMGVESHIASSGREALAVVKEIAIHAAVIDLATPAEDGAHGDAAGGLWLLEVLHRLPQHPPVVVVNSRSWSQAQIQRALQDAMRLGAFSVVNRPVRMDALLQTFRRVVEMHYRGQWPAAQPAA